MISKDELKKEIFKTEMELSVSQINDGWWNEFMKKKLQKLKEKLEDDNSWVLDKKDRSDIC